MFMLRSLKSKILLAEIVPILLVVFVLGVLADRFIERALLDAKEDQMHAAVAGLVQDVEHYLRSLSEMVEGIDLTDYHRTARAEPLARQFARLQNNLQVLCLLDADGREEIRVAGGQSSRELRDHGESPVLPEAMQHPNEVVFSSIRVHSGLEAPHFHLALARYGYFGDEFHGVLWADVTVASMVERFLAEVPVDKGIISLVDAQGRLLYHSETGYAGEPAAAGGPEGRRLLEEARGLRAGFGRGVLQGIDGFVAHAPVEKLGFSVLLTVPSSDFLAASRDLQTLVLLLCLVALAGGTVLALLLGRNFTRDLLRIGRHVELVAEGDLGQRLRIGSGDELQRLAVSINAMTENLQHSLSRERSLNEMLQSIVDPLLVGDCFGRISAVNDAAAALVGRRRDDLLERNLAELFNDDLFSGGGDEPLLAHGAMRDVECRLTGADGEKIPVLLSCSSYKGEDGECAGVVAIVKDITERYLAEKEKERLAYYDSLTGLPNRLLLGDRIEQALARAKREEHCSAILFLDLDQFKVVNDTLGHHAGDQLLRVAAERLKGCIRRSDTLARIGGDEFVVMLSHVKAPEDASVLAEKIFQRLARPFDVQGQEIYTGASIGIALYPQDGADTYQLLKSADMAMYQAKAKGRGGFEFFSAELNEKAQKRLEMENRLRRAVQEGHFVLHFQKRVDVRSGAFMGAEALVRWLDPERGLVPPLDFIPLSEENGLIIPIGEWVLRQACRQGREWQETGLSIGRISVNISSRQIHHGGFDATVAAALEESGLPAECLELELTESILVDPDEEALRTLSRLKEMGVTLSIDDFGTGYSSLAYLKRFPVDVLKIDRSFVKDLPEDGDSAAIVKSMVSLGHNLGLKVVAEGVESAEQKAFLQQQQCHEIQGFFYGRPVPAEELAREMGQGGS